MADLAAGIVTVIVLVGLVAFTVLPQPFWANALVQWIVDEILAGALLIVLSGIAVWLLQDRWIRQRMRAEKDFEVLRGLIRQMAPFVADVAELRGVLVLEPRNQARANELLPRLTEQAYRLAEEARLIFGNTLLLAQFQLLTVLLGKMTPGTVIGAADLDKLLDAVLCLQRTLYDQDTFGRNLGP